jgi:putative tryptophan/tyrosine transport system substrate-binding protein
MQPSRFLIASFLCYCVVAAAVVAQAVEPKKVGFLSFIQRPEYDPSKDAYKVALIEGLKERGYIDGQNIRIDYRVPRNAEEVVEMANALVAEKVDVIATRGSQTIEAVRHATNTIPIVIIACDRADRIVARISRPGGNVTGMACISSDLARKRLQLLQEVAPGFKHLSVLYNASVSAKIDELHDIQAVTGAMEIEVEPVEVRAASDFAAAFAKIKDSGAQALIPLSDPLTFIHVKEIAAFAAERHLPSIYGYKEFCDAGGLLCYGTSMIVQYHRFAYFIDKIFKGTKPGDIPIEEPTKLDLVVNARTAKLLGLSLPQSILVSADEVDE